MFLALVIVLLTISLGRAAYLEQRYDSATATLKSDSSKVPQYFQTTPELFAGPTATGRAPFLAETNPAPFGPSRSFVPNTPLETALPIAGNAANTSIFQLMGQLSPYAPNPRFLDPARLRSGTHDQSDTLHSGFGVDEYPLPPGSKISQVHVIHRHGSRYPTSDAPVQKFGVALTQAIKDGAKFTGELSFLNDWSYELGAEILVPVGRQELFESGVLHYYQYGHLYNTSTKIIARTTTQDRMLKSAEYFMAGFFGLEWTNNATLEVIIEGDGFNNSLAGYDNCNNSDTGVASGGTNASAIWESNYLPNATHRFQELTKNFTWNVSDAYNAQTLCPYETVAFGYSAFCDLFTFQEWEGFEYSIDISFAGNNYFQSPVGRAVGIAYVAEVLARLNHHVLLTSDTQANITLDNNTSTFPLNQTLYFDFSHDTNIAAVLTAFGLTQFAGFLPTSGPPPNRQLIVSHLQPFAARLDIEIIAAPHPVAANRTGGANAYLAGGPTTYVHFIINQRTVPLGVSLPACGNRTDGWCEIHKFLESQSKAVEEAEYDYSCNGNYPVTPYGSLSNGVPPPKS
ncbi:hypothetical protein MMC07_006265 [Pseudocyphellaria aurata]|nr:hypothetical protein [Pseudocyphellaria aurata]